MNNTAHYSERLGRNVIPRARVRAAHSDQHQQGIVHTVCGVLKQCFKRVILEAA
jgi:hypothetical protein